MEFLLSRRFLTLVIIGVFLSAALIACAAAIAVTLSHTIVRTSSGGASGAGAWEAAMPETPCTTTS